MARLPDIEPPADHWDQPTWSRFRRSVRSWWAKSGRALPWRSVRDPYRVWLSEIMLQQTTVTAVIPYFERFLQRYPTLADLADADVADVLRLWEGLGYYSRARNLHRAAGVIQSQFAGEFPRDIETLCQLPGIGRYTAGAIRSFAFNQPAPIVEANTARLYARLLGYPGDIKTPAGQKMLWAFAAAAVPAKEPGNFNQALMDLGATVCTPTAPRCGACPVRSCCAAAATGDPERFPQAARRPKITDVTEITVAIRHEARYLVRQRRPDERWAGMWDFPRFELPVADTNSPPDAKALRTAVAAQTGVQIDAERLLCELKHGVTRYRITLLCFVAEYRRGSPDANLGEFRWVTMNELQELPLPVTGRRFVKQLLEPRLF